MSSKQRELMKKQQLKGIEPKKVSDRKELNKLVRMAAQQRGEDYSHLWTRIQQEKPVVCIGKESYLDAVERIGKIIDLMEYVRRNYVKNV